MKFDTMMLLFGIVIDAEDDLLKSFLFISQLSATLLLRLPAPKILLIDLRNLTTML